MCTYHTKKDESVALLNTPLKTINRACANNLLPMTHSRTVGDVWKDILQLRNFLTLRAGESAARHEKLPVRCDQRQNHFLPYKRQSSAVLNGTWEFCCTCGSLPGESGESVQQTAPRRNKFAQCAINYYCVLRHEERALAAGWFMSSLCAVRWSGLEHNFTQRRWNMAPIQRHHQVHLISSLHLRTDANFAAQEKWTSSVTFIAK